MPHIDLGSELPGLPALLAYRPETAGPLRALAEALLRGPGLLSTGERELIAAYVSELNACGFCAGSHGACAAELLGDDSVLGQVTADLDAAPVTPRLRALLRLAEAVQRGGTAVTPELVADAKTAGAADQEIHDAILIAAAFCMYNRYVDGLATTAPADPGVYAMMARGLATGGYA
ncbi:Carboxymuconolactone decarboxylase family protein [Actinomadura rubteroloni]|uniref:Carboxymuconolactone decarboxylase family protein n=1 Tax=Actinomadura rubteroloni TaxID=1926885 RepID=A0A2P4URM4_9ACTN|nr:Carboxymuconolactone decarboxylase family protein [Actinomadura rubteroloni]